MENIIVFEIIAKLLFFVNKNHKKYNVFIKYRHKFLLINQHIFFIQIKEFPLNCLK